MARPVKEWIGAKETTTLPESVWLRVLERHGWQCAVCQRPHRLVKLFHKDHICALVNWVGAAPHGNRETNIQPLCEACHGIKTKKDVAIRALSSGRKKMRPGYARPEKQSRFKETRERLKLKYNWAKRRYEPSE
jgi:5-methylcytosine-specific restriction endonuclease McrA